MSLVPTLIIAAALGADPAGVDQKVVDQSETAKRVDFIREVRPLLSNRCFRCHGPDDGAHQADLRLDHPDAAARELPTGSRAVIPGRPEASELIARVTSDDESLAMPPKGVGKPLTPDEIETLRRWISEGAEYKQHWAYVAPRKPAVPIVVAPGADATRAERLDSPEGGAWARNEIDWFILARLDREGLRPSAAADRFTLLRRVSLDLTGLPPTPEEADRFVADERPDAYERVVDDLLSRSTYGERWAAVWLDLARYGDSQGYIHDPPRTIWRWRDWLIQALNDNLPYDQFSIEMLAGDLLPGPTPAQIIATGFHRNTTNNTEGGANSEEYRHASVVDRVNTTMQVWMGSTFACAQCHNHKYDPFTQKEYYQLFAILNGTEDNNGEAPILETPQVGHEAEAAALAARLVERQQLEAATKKTDAEQAAWEASVDRAALARELAEILDLPADQRKKEQIDKLAAHHRSLSPEWKGANDAVQALRGRLDQVATTTLVMKEGPARPTHVAIRGEYQNKGEQVAPGLPAVLHAAAPEAKLDRLGLARWIVDPANPLTARVAVNRLWQEIFGIGIVETSEEFGIQGEPPSHPELLDWLATEYVRLGWDTKRLLKLIVMSAAYRQTSQVGDDLATRDPLNRLLARGPRVRLPAEAVRDQALAAAGLLSSKLYGPSVHPPQPQNGLAAAFGPSTDWETSAGEDRHRRALYTRWRRNLPYPSMITFDTPERSVCSMRRIRTNTPLQALVTLNDPVYVEAVQALARRVLRDGGETSGSQADFAFRRVLTRPPTDHEVQRIVALHVAARQSLAADPARAAALATKPAGPLPDGMDALDAAAWTVVGNVLLNLDEFLSKP